MERCPHKLTQSFIMQESGLGLLLLLHHLQVLGRLVEAEGGQGRGGAPPSPSWCAYRLARSDSLSTSLIQTDARSSSESDINW
jgi:hypothetical protein